MAAGFVGFEITWRKDVFSDAPQAGSAEKFGTLGINFRARKAANEEELDRGHGGAELRDPDQRHRRAEAMTRTSIDVESLRQMLEQGEPVTVLDVRPEDQSTEWWIPGRVHFDAYGALKAKDPTP